MTRGCHYYIVSMDNGNVLAPYITDDRDVGCHGMAVDINVYQYNQATTAYKNQYKEYRQSFKWLLEPVGGGSNLVRFNNKSTGMYLAVKGDSRQAAAHLCQAKDGNIDWKLLGVGEGNHAAGYTIVNDLTGGRIAVPSSHPANETVAVQHASRNGDTPEKGWKLVEANKFERENHRAGTPTFEMAGIRDNNWFSVVAPHPGGNPLVGVTLSERIAAIGKMVGLFPSQEEIKVLYHAFLVALRQIVVRQALVEDRLNEVLREWSDAHVHLNACKDSKDLQKLQKALVEAETVYAGITDRLMVGDVKEAGLILFLQAASEHLATILAMDSLSTGSTGQALKATVQHYAAHLLDTFQQLKEKRMALITEYSFFGYRYVDEYQRLRIMSCRDDKRYHTFAEYREIMATHFDAEFGNPVLLARSWAEQATLSAGAKALISKGGMPDRGAALKTRRISKCHRQEVMSHES